MPGPLQYEWDFEAFQLYSGSHKDEDTPNHHYQEPSPPVSNDSVIQMDQPTTDSAPTLNNTENSTHDTTPATTTSSTPPGRCPECESLRKELRWTRKLAFFFIVLTFVCAVIGFVVCLLNVIAIIKKRREGSKS